MRGFLDEPIDDRETAARDDFDVVCASVRKGTKSRAELFKIDGREIWVPTALIRRRERVPGNSATLERVTLPEWFATKKGLT
jgi:hypothetical protein